MDKKPYIIKRENGERVAYRNEAYWKHIAQLKYELLLKRSGIPPFYWSIDWKDYKGDLSRDNLKKVIQYADECFTEKFDYVNLYIWCGANSSQKTAVMCNVGKEAIKQGKRVSFILAGVLTDYLLKNSGYSYNEEIAGYLKELQQADMLLIDDVFDENKSTVWNSNSLIIAEIDKWLRPLFSTNIKVVMTSNVSPENIIKKYGKSMAELVTRNCVPLEFKDDIKKERTKNFANLFDVK